LIDSDNIASIQIHVRSLVCLFVGDGDGSRYFLQAWQAISAGLQYHVIDLRMRHVLNLHDYLYYVGRKPLLRKLIASVSRGAEVVIVVGRRDRKVAITDSQLLVPRNGVPTPLPHQQRPARSLDDCNVLFLGHLSAHQAVTEIRQPLATPTLARRRWRATVTGDGPVNEFYRLARDLSIADRVHLSGWIDTALVSRPCAKADVLVLPSHAEGMAMSVLEAISHGLAVITTPIGAYLEVIDHNVSSLLVSPGDASALPEVLGPVIDDDDLRQHLARARERLLRGSNIRAYTTRLENVHRALLARRPATPIGLEQLS
jgi:glycosyltransferase involved in cell wall biosynthesis